MGETVQYKNLKGPELVSGPLNVDNHHLLVIGIKTIAPGHLEILFRDMLDEQFNEINCRKSPLDEGVVFIYGRLQGGAGEGHFL